MFSNMGGIKRRLKRLLENRSGIYRRRKDGVEVVACRVWDPCLVNGIRVAPGDYVIMCGEKYSALTAKQFGRKFELT